ncbi:hypothetical protein OPQ81_011917 [Rhizoctonia solani]|nr:hypothetical protein OPQ81_011917 [Rhizoctonia solani]
MTVLNDVRNHRTRSTIDTSHLQARTGLHIKRHPHRKINRLLYPNHKTHEMDSAPPAYNPDPTQEDQIRAALEALQKLFDERARARTRGDQAQVALIEERTAEAMRRVADAYGGEAGGNWNRQAEILMNANPEERENILMPIAKGLGLLIAAPLALAGVIVVGAVGAVGGVLYGVGKVLQGLGGLLTAGMLR